MTDLASDSAARLTGAWIVRLLLLVFAAGLAWALGTLPPAAGLSGTVRDALPASGVDHDVTAVLMNFRAYDTLLELTVLLLALLGIRMLGVAGGSTRDPGPILRTLAMLLIPFLILFAGYLLWAGAHEPGGAFQAGTLLAAAGVLGALAGFPWVLALPDSRLRALVLVGPVVFACTGGGVMLTGHRFLEFPAPQAGGLILLIEAAATVSIGVTLLAAFHGARAGADGDPP